MANLKIGLEYYNIDTNRYQDIKIKRLKKDFGCSGISVYDYILCEIYRVKGCFIVWDESTAFDVAEYFGIKESLVNEIINYCGVVGLFSKELLIDESVISSLSIQKRYLDICNRAKRINYFIPENIKLTEESHIITEESHIITEESHITQPVCAEVKESKVKKRKPKESISENDKNWKNDFNVYVEDLRVAYLEIQNDLDWIKQQETYYQNVDILKSIEKACVNYWSTPAGWKKKKQSKISEINWKSTFGNAISLNKVYNGNSNLQQKAGSGNKTNGSNTFRNDAEKRNAERSSLKELSLAILQQSQT